HAYAHSMQCQIDYHPRYQSDMAMTDGEGMERIWSYLGNFVSITCQINAERRQSTLDHAIQHFRWKKLLNLCKPT
ncbi:hypothetical protein BJV82DRAFT_523101, partial [Fennellomyces sp. T-0311]